MPPVPVDAPPTPAPPPVPAPPLPDPPDPTCVVPPLPVDPPWPAWPPWPDLPPWAGAPPVADEPPDPDAPPPAAVPPWLVTPPAPGAPPLPVGDDVLDKQAVPQIASTATVEWTKRAGVMNASLIAEDRSTAANPDSLDSCLQTCKPQASSVGKKREHLLAAKAASACAGERHGRLHFAPKYLP